MLLNNLSTTSNIIDIQPAKDALYSLGYPTNSFPYARIFLVNTDSAQNAFVTLEGGKPVVNIPVPSPGAIKFTAFTALQSVFNNMGITAEWMTTTNIPSGVCEIFINPR
jgi:hypothetical protein